MKEQSEALSYEERIEQGFKDILTVANDRYVKIVSIRNDRDYYAIKADLDISFFNDVIVEKAVIEVEFLVQADNTIFLIATKPQVTVISHIAMEKKTYEYLYVPTGLAYLIAIKGLLERCLRQSK